MGVLGSNTFCYRRRASSTQEPSTKRQGVSLFPLLQCFLDEFPDRFHIHPFGAVDEGIAIIIAFRSAVAARHFVFRNIDAQRIRSIIALGKQSLIRDLPLAGEEPI